MGIFDLIFMVCLSLGQGSDCKKQVLQCVTDIRDSRISSFLSNNPDVKLMSPSRFLESQPAAEWIEWVLDCAKEQRKRILGDLSKEKKGEKKESGSKSQGGVAK